MRQAFRILGYPNPYHFTSLFENVQDADMWQDAFEAKYQGKGTFGHREFDQLLGHVGAVTDSPCVAFSEELIEAYPNAKVVLAERNIDTWYKSWNALVEASFKPLGTTLSYTDPWWFGRIWGIVLLWFECQVGAKGPDQARRNGKSTYRRHYEEVRELVPRERLLEYKLGSGWEPLCEFLGKDIPDVPFPCLNESSDLKPLVKSVGKKALLNSMRNTFFVGVSIVVAVAIWRSFRFS